MSSPKDVKPAKTAKDAAKALIAMDKASEKRAKKAAK